MKKYIPYLLKFSFMIFAVFPAIKHEWLAISVGVIALAIPLVCYYAKKYRTEILSQITKGADSKSRKKELAEEYYHNTFTTLDRGSLRNRVEQLITDNSPCGESTAAAKINEQIENALK